MVNQVEKNKKFIILFFLCDMLHVIDEEVVGKVATH